LRCYQRVWEGGYSGETLALYGIGLGPDSVGLRRTAAAAAIRAATAVTAARAAAAATRAAVATIAVAAAVFFFFLDSASSQFYYFFFFPFLMEKMSWAVDLEAQQISKLNEHLLVAGRIRNARRNARQGNGWLKNKLLNLSHDGTPAPSFPINLEESALTTRFVGPQAPNDRVTRSGTCIPSLESSSLKNPDSGSKAPAVLVTIRGSARQPLSAKTNVVARSGSKGSHNDENIHQSSQSHNPLLMPTQGVAEATETPNPAHFIQVPPFTFCPTCIADLLAISIGPGFGLGDVDAITTGQVAQDHSTAKAKASSSKFTQRRQLTTPALAPSTPPLIAPTGNGTGSTPPSGEEPQGLSPVDYELKLEADFPLKMVLEMQEGAVRKA
jgi:hypothetical protein